MFFSRWWLVLVMYQRETPPHPQFSFCPVFTFIYLHNVICKNPNYVRVILLINLPLSSVSRRTTTFHSADKECLIASVYCCSYFKCMQQNMLLVYTALNFSSIQLHFLFCCLCVYIWACKRLLLFWWLMFSSLQNTLPGLIWLLHHSSTIWYLLGYWIWYVWLLIDVNRIKKAMSN